MLQDVYNRTIDFTFDTSTDDDPLTVGFDVWKYNSPNYTDANPTITLNLSHFTSPRNVSLYIVGNYLRKRARLDLIRVCISA